MFDLALLFVYVFLCPFTILITLLGEEGAGLVFIVHLFVSYAHVNLYHFFSSSCRGLAAASACGSSWTFLFTLRVGISNRTRQNLVHSLNYNPFLSYMEHLTLRVRISTVRSEKPRPWFKFRPVDSHDGFL